MRIAALYTTLLIYNFVLVLFTKHKFGKCIPIPFIILALELFACSMMGNIYYLKYLVLISLFVSLFIILYKRKAINKSMISSYFNLSFIIFSFVFIFVYFRTKNLYLSNIDDLHYYSRLVKDVMRNGVLYTNSLETTVSPGSYPPFCVLLQSSFCVFLGGYSEARLLFSMASFSLSFFIILFDKLTYKSKDILKGIIIIAIMFIVTLSIQQNQSMAQPVYIYNSIYNDWLISIISAFIYFLVFSEDSNTFVIIITGSALCLIKPHSLPLYLLAVFAYIIKGKFYNKRNIRKVIQQALVLLIPVLIYFLVDIYKGSICGGSMFSASVSTLNGASTSIYKNLTTELWQRYSYALLFEPVMSKPINISYSFMVMLETVILVLISKNYKIDILISFIVGAIGYAIMLYFTFLSRGSDEGLGLVMYGRYMQTYTYIGLLLIMYLLISNRDKIYILIIYLASSLLFVETDSVKYIIPFKEIEVFKENERKELQYYLDTEYNNEKMIVLNCTNINYFALLENIIDVKKDNITYLVENFETNRMSLDSFIDICKNNDLLFIGDYNTEFNSKIWKKLTDTPCYNSSLYKIIKNNDNIIDFELLYTWDK